MARHMSIECSRTARSSKRSPARISRRVLHASTGESRLVPTRALPARFDGIQSTGTPSGSGTIPGRSGATTKTRCPRLFKARQNSAIKGAATSSGLAGYELVTTQRFTCSAGSVDGLSDHRRDALDLVVGKPGVQGQRDRACGIGLGAFQVIVSPWLESLEPRYAGVVKAGLPIVGGEGFYADLSMRLVGSHDRHQVIGAVALVRY